MLYGIRDIFFNEKAPGLNSTHVTLLAPPPKKKQKNNKLSSYMEDGNYTVIT